MKTDLGKNAYYFVAIDKHLIYFPIDSGRLVSGSFEIPGPWVESASRQDLLDAYAGWGPHHRGSSQGPQQMAHPRLAPAQYLRRREDTDVGGAGARDASHLGAGVGQGFEDAFALCQLLSHPATTPSNDVFRAYDAVRRARANSVLERSVRAGNIYEVYGKPGYQAADMWPAYWSLYGLTTSMQTSPRQLKV
ncbi:hypothetical protein B0H10DRAFT_2385465, partial [Mycena sp. CBHHK59/15]